MTNPPPTPAEPPRSALSTGGADAGVTRYPATPEPEAQLYARYWRFNLILIACLCVVGGTVSFVLPLFATGLAQVHWRGWSLPYYMGAQGATLIYLLLICLYVVLMQLAEHRLRRRLIALRSAERT